MFQKFFEDTIESKFIKNLLYNTPIPLPDTISDGDYILKDIIYIYKNSIVKCIKSGIFRDIKTKNDNLGEIEYVSNYMFGEDKFQTTEIFKSNVRYYDSDTHLYLGKLLRCIRDIYGIDLMPFYNCFNYKVVQDIYLSKNKDAQTNGGVVVGYSDKYKVLAIPIKFNRTYKISIDSSTEVLMKSVLYGKYGLIRSSKDQYSYVSSNLLEDEQLLHGEESVVKINSMRFNHPFEYKISNTEEKFNLEDAKKFQQLEKYLYLLVQLPKSNKSSICVIESDYENTNYDIVNLPGWIESASDKDANKILISNLSLQRINTKNTYAFSDRLIENLLLNVINNNDLIENNIYWVHSLMNVPKYVSYEPYTFTLYDRYILFRKYMKCENVDHVDVTGFVDKDMEKFILRGHD